MKVKTYFKERKAKGALRTKLKMDIGERDNFKCQNPYCKHGYPLDIPHHVKKRSQGGSNDPKNLVLLCCQCHDKIHARGTLKVTGEYPNFKWEKIKK